MANPSPSTLNLYLLTYNCARTLINPDVFAPHFFDGLHPNSNSNPTPSSTHHPPDLIILHLQEFAPIANAFCSSGVSKYFDRLRSTVRIAVQLRFPDVGDGDGHGEGYVELKSGHAGMTAIMLFVRNGLEDRVIGVKEAEVGVGVQRMGNKGAIGLRVGVRTTEGWKGGDDARREDEVMYLTFVAAHLAPMEEALERRNQDYADIVAGLVFGSDGSTTVSSTARASGEDNGEDEPLLSANSEDEVAQGTSSKPTRSSRLIGIYEPDTHLFFAGDLNYRTSITRPVHDGSDTKSFPQPNAPPSSPTNYTIFLKRDQLTSQLHAGKTLHGLTEHAIDFPPTYKYSSDNCANKDIMLDSEVTEWKWSNHRWPSWCDRILFSASPSSSSTSVTVKTYTALPLLATSDHRPVALSVSVPLSAVRNPDFAAHRPVKLDPDWKANRQTARMKELVVGTAWHAMSTSEGLLNLTIGVAAVVCFAVLATVYARDW